MSAREEVAKLLAEHEPEMTLSVLVAEVVYDGCACGWYPAWWSEGGSIRRWFAAQAAHQVDVLMAEDWIDDRPVPCGSEAYIPSDYYRTENYGWVRCGGYLGEGHIHEDSNTGYQWDDAGNPLR